MRVVELALFAGALLVAGLVASAIAWSGTGPYRDLARDNGVTGTTFTRPGTGGASSDVAVDLNELVGWHEQWSRYEIGLDKDPPGGASAGFFTADEYAHMADVRRVFDVAKFMIPVGLFVMLVRLQRARARSPREMWQLLRDGSLWSLGLVAVIGLVAVVAFEPLFLAFHYVFFPQGNFLFPPTSNLIRLYPDWYWEGITLRVGVSFIAVALGLAALAQSRLRAAK